MHRFIVRLAAIFFILLFCVPTSHGEVFDYPAGGSRKSVGISTDVIAIGVPLAAATYVMCIKDWDGLLRGSLETVGVVGTSSLLKELTHSERPDHSNDHSFPSLHTATSFLAASFMMRRYGWKFGVPAYALAAYVGWGRIYSKKHHFWDVAAGAALGTAVGLLFTTPYMKEHNVTVSPGLISTPSPIPNAASDLQLSLTGTITF